ncbi:MAG: hypothetical protein K2Q09_00015 [Phycisphaerales bacterium]|nr:hypothetical protein [Phycisphaerales bacterium]
MVLVVVSVVLVVVSVVPVVSVVVTVVVSVVVSVEVVVSVVVSVVLVVSVVPVVSVESVVSADAESAKSKARHTRANKQSFPRIPWFKTRNIFFAFTNLIGPIELLLLLSFPKIYSVYKKNIQSTRFSFKLMILL